MAEVVLERVGKTYPNGVRAVHDLTLTVADGELVVLVGPSGCGKTTTLRLIAGLETPTAGTVRIGGRVVNAEPPHRRDVAMVFQRPALYPHLNVRENLAFGLAAPAGRCWRWRNGRERRRRVERAARLLRAERPARPPAAASCPAGSSSGWRWAGRWCGSRPCSCSTSRSATSMPAPHGNAPRVALAPSPSSGDNGLCHPRSGGGHDPGRSRGACWTGATVQQADRPEVLYERPANRFVAGFIGWPPMNFLDGRLVEQDGRLLLTARRRRRCRWPSGRTNGEPFAGRDVDAGHPARTRAVDGRSEARRHGSAPRRADAVRFGLVTLRVRRTGR